MWCGASDDVLEGVVVSAVDGVVWWSSPLDDMAMILRLSVQLGQRVLGSCWSNGPAKLAVEEDPGLHALLGRRCSTWHQDLEKDLATGCHREILRNSRCPFDKMHIRTMARCSSEGGLKPQQQEESASGPGPSRFTTPSSTRSIRLEMDVNNGRETEFSVHTPFSSCT